MKKENRNSELPPVTYGEAIQMLNGLCEGLGDQVRAAFNQSFFTMSIRTKHAPVSDFVSCGFWWRDSELGEDFWSDINYMLLEIESGAGIKK